jgi:hypothetical protein
MVRGAGLEPARYFYHEPLKLACLPVPPPAHKTSCRISQEGKITSITPSPPPSRNYLEGALGDAGECGTPGKPAGGAGTAGTPILPAGLVAAGRFTLPSKMLPVTRCVDA